MVKLGDLCTKESSSIVQKQLAGCDGNYPIFGAAGFIKNIDFYQQENPYIAVVKDGAGVGRVMLLPGKSSVIGTMQYIIPKEGINAQYLAFAMESMNLAKYYSGATIPHIYFKDYCNEVLPNHTLDQQNHIASTLTQTANIISLRKHQLEKLDQLVKAKFLEMFGNPVDNPNKWAERPLFTVCSQNDDIKCGPFGTQLSKAEYQSYGIPLWGIPQINSFFTKPVTDYLSQEKAVELTAYSLLPGDIAMSRKGNVGMCALYPDDFEPGIIHSDVLRIRADKNIANPNFLMHQLHISPIVATQIGTVSSGAIMSGINVSKLKNILIQLPPLALQNKFDEFVIQMDIVKQSFKKSFSKLDMLKKSLMQEYFG